MTKYIFEYLGPAFDYPTELARIGDESENMNPIEKRRYLKTELRKFERAKKYDGEKPMYQLFMDQLRKLALGTVTMPQHAEKIQWNGTHAEIICLFELLHDADLVDFEVDDKKQWVLIRDHFRPRKGKPFDNLRLRKIYDNSNRYNAEELTKRVLTKLGCRRV